MDRQNLERTAVTLFGIAALVEAIVCGAVIVSGWFAGAIADPPERVFWFGAALAGLAIVVLGAAAVPGGQDDARALRRTRLLLRIGLAMFLIAPALCVGALVVNFFAY